MSKKDGGMVVVVYILFSIVIAIAVIVGAIFHKEIGSWFQSDSAPTIENKVEQDEAFNDDNFNEEVGDFEKPFVDDDENWTKNY